LWLHLQINRKLWDNGQHVHLYRVALLFCFGIAILCVARIQAFLHVTNFCLGVACFGSCSRTYLNLEIEYCERQYYQLLRFTNCHLHWGITLWNACILNLFTNVHIVINVRFSKIRVNVKCTLTANSSNKQYFPLSIII